MMARNSYAFFIRALHMRLAPLEEAVPFSSLYSFMPTAEVARHEEELQVSRNRRLHCARSTWDFQKWHDE